MKFRDLFGPGRSTVHSTGVMAATSHPLATATALDVLREGGNAVDAGIAACAVLAVVEPQMTGIGGDCFCLLAKNGTAPVLAYNGSGRAPAGATLARYREAGISAIDPMGPHAVTIPGAIEAWHRLVTDHGTIPFGTLLEPAARFASEGHPLHERIIFDIKSFMPKVKRAEGFAALILDDGKLPQPGRLYTNRALGQTLREIAKGGPDAFYRGAIAEHLAAFLSAKGGFQTPADFAAHKGNYVEPVAADYRGLTVYQCPPNGQGIITLLLLRILSHLDVAADAPDSPERFHKLMEAARIAFSVRDCWLADPEHYPVPWEHFLDDAFTKAAAESIRPDSVVDVSEPVDLPEHKDTVYLTVVDRDRTAFSLINSIFEPFGSALYEPETGILLQNRGRSFTLKDGHPNSIAPGKRPMHTIIPGMVLKGDKVLYSYGVMGGHFQPVGHATLLSNLIDYGMDMQQAADAPRCFPQDGKVMVEHTVPEATRARLAEIGHPVELRADPIGGAQAIRIDPETNVLSGCSDPRKDGCALGF
ncbi:gamma-glutamyltransferase [Aquabacter sp. CN5-332]|uniref:gamma-glutamyltransferase n=1 Tax=Aquabacter sp. CN5-332 TaxID=3156608 RepID=UPI0032B53424